MRKNITSFYETCAESRVIMGAILKGIQSVLIALGIIAVVGTGIILYYNAVKPDDEETAAVETQAETESQAETETETDAADNETGDEAEVLDASLTGDTASSVFSAENGHEHTYTTTVLKPATCTETGQVEYRCYCGDYYVDSIKALDHTPGDWITVRSATTTQTGLRQKSCKICGRVLQEESVPMLKASDTATNSSNSSKNDKTSSHTHSYTYEITEEATCTEKGEKTYTCTICGNTFKTSIPATNHPSRKTVRTEGDCGDPGTIETICNICDAVISSETLYYEHDWGSWETTTEPTTTSTGVRTRTCKDCGEEETKTISRLSSSSSSSSGGSNNSSGSSGSGSSGSDNSSSDNSGSGSGSSGTSHTHKYTSVVTTQATCTSAGVTTYTCSCGNSYTEAAPEALGHKASGNWITVTPATETTEGERVQYCSRCGEVARTESIAKLEDTHTHAYTTSVIVKQPTCTSTGTRRRICSCGYYITSSIPKTGHTDSDGDGRCDVCGVTIS